MIANDRPLVVQYQGDWLFPIVTDYPETHFGGDFATPADYTDPFVQDLIRTGGDEVLEDGEAPGWMALAADPLQPYDTVDYDVATAPSDPDAVHLLGTDDQARDVLARVIYGFRLSVLFGFGVTLASAVIGIVAGRGAGLLRRLGRSCLPAGRGDLAVDEHALRHPDPVGGARAQPLGDVPDLRRLLLDAAHRAWCAPSSCARAISNT